MSEDAEWIDFCGECNTVRPKRPSTTTRRPFWAVTQRPYPATAWPPRTTPSTAHDGAERSVPLQPSAQSTAIYASLGVVLLLVLLALVVYLLVLRRKLSKIQSNRRPQDYSLRVEDVAHLSSPIDDSSQLYVNTSDLHKLVSSAKARTGSPSAPPLSSGVPGARAKCPVPEEVDNNVNQSQNSKISLSMVKKFTERINAVGLNLRNSLKISRKETGSELNSGYNSSAPDVVKVGIPEVLYDDDDLWSEDSFDSSSVEFENETAHQPTRKSSMKENTHGKPKRSLKRKKISPPCVPPPPPPASKPSALTNVENFSSSPRYEIEKSFAPVHKAPSISGAQVNDGGSSPVYGNIEASVSHAAIRVPQLPTTQALGDESHDALKSKVHSPDSSEVRDAKIQSIKKPLLPPNRPVKQQNISTTHSNSVTERLQNVQSNDPTSRNTNFATSSCGTGKKDAPSVPSKKPSPPKAPKPNTAANALPKLKLNLVVPKASRASEATPDTTTTVVFGTPSNDSHLFGNKMPSLLTSEKSNENKVENVDPSSLSVSARRALMENKALASNS